MKAKILLSLIVLFSLSLSIAAQENESISKTFPASAGDNLKLKINPGNISISTWTKSEVSIEVTGIKGMDIENIESKKTGNTINFDLDLDGGWNNNVQAEISVPENMNIYLKTTGGNIKINDNIKGILEAETDGGNVKFASVEGNTSVNTYGGNISGNDINGETKLHTKGGNIKVGNVKNGSAKIDTYGGNISVGNVASELEAKTHGGNVSVSDIGGSATVFTYGGQISLGNVTGSAKMETYGGNLKLESASGIVEAVTKGGNIGLNKVTGSVSVETMAGNVFVELSPKAGSSSSIQTHAGNVELKIPSSAKTKIDVYVESEDISKGKDVIESDFPSSKYNVDKRAEEVEAEYTLNGGGSQVSVKCYHGKVKIKKQ